MLQEWELLPEKEKRKKHKPKQNEDHQTRVDQKFMIVQNEKHF